MISKEKLKEQLTNTLEETELNMGKRVKGKVRDIYELDDNKMLIVTSDRISCFDVIVGTVPFKGQVLNQLAAFWFEKTEDIVKNHIIDIPDPNVMVVKKCKPLPVEVILRGYITGSLWRAYEKGERELYGLKFNANLKKDQKFDAPILTPTTKAEQGDHDTPISREEIIEQGLVDKETWEKIEKISLKLFERGTEISGKNGLILVDTKYEFGLLDGEIVLIDEVHTPDSSRYWYANTYEELFEKGESQQILDKEYVRQWLIGKGFMGDGEAPPLTDEVIIEASRRYIEAFEQVTGQEFDFSEGHIMYRLESNLKEKGYLE